MEARSGDNGAITYVDFAARLWRRAETHTPNVLRHRPALQVRRAMPHCLDVEVQRRRDDVDVRDDVRGEVVPVVARDVLRAALPVLVDIVLRGEEPLRLRDAHVQVQVPSVLAEPDPGRVHAVVDEP